MAECGYTSAHIDDLPMQDVLGLLRYWRDHPSTPTILAAVHRVARAAPQTMDDPSGIGALMARFPDGHVTSQGR